MNETKVLDAARQRLADLVAKTEGANLKALSLELGRSPTYLQDYLDGSPRQLKYEDRVFLAQRLGCGVTELTVKGRTARNPQQAVAGHNISNLEYLGNEGARRFEGPKDLPILGHVKAGADGRFFDQGETHGVTMRPDVLMHVRQAYSVRVQDMSMFPAYEPNDLVYVNPTLAVVPDSNVVIQLHDGQAFVKRLIRRTEKAVICQEWYPEKREIKYDPKDILHIHMIVRIK